MKKTGSCIVALFFSVSVLLITTNLGAATLDSGFGPNNDGKTLTDFKAGYDQAYALAVQEDGKIVVAGYNNDDGNFNIALARYNSDGNEDTTFGLDGQVIENFAGNDAALAIALQTEGSILLAGYMTNSGRKEVALLRYDKDGLPDAVFNLNVDQALSQLIDETATAYGVAVQADGKIVVAGLVGDAGSERAFVIRFNEDGSEDDSFDEDGIVIVEGENQSAAKALILDKDENILLAGWKKENEQTSASLFRFTTAGEPDKSFDSDGSVSVVIDGADSVANTLSLQSDGKIVLAGYADGDTGKEILLARYDQGGVLDLQFGDDGLVQESMEKDTEAYDVAISDDGIIYVTGYGDNGIDKDVLFVRYGTDGSFVNFAILPSVESDGDVEASTITINKLQVKEEADGIDDIAIPLSDVLTPIGEDDDVAQALLVQADGAVLVAGYAVSGDGADFALLRFVEVSSESTTLLSTEYYLIGTTPVSNVTRNSAVTGGVIALNTDDDSTPTITIRGVVFSIVPHPVYRASDDGSTTTAASEGDTDEETSSTVVRLGQTSDGTGTGTFGSDIFDITPDVRYYVRAYGVLSDGTVIYGEEFYFETKDACFIATAAYGSILDKHVQVLREFRDTYLKGNVVGEKFIGWYYRWSPSLADVIASNETLRTVTRVALLPLIGLSHFMLHTGMPVKIMIMMGFLALFTLLLRHKLRFAEIHT